MLPNTRIFIDFENSNNSFLYNQSWSEVAVHAAYNLLRLPQRIAQYNATNAEIDEVSMRTLALSIGIMAQVRIAHANILEVKQRFELDDKVYQAYKKHLKVAGASYKSGSSLSQLELDRLELETAETYINRLVSMSNYYVAYYRLLNTLGIKDLSPETIERIIADIKKVKLQNDPKLAKGVKKFAPVKLPSEELKKTESKKTDKELNSVIPDLVQR
jgi:hypothetical protein